MTIEINPDELWARTQAYARRHHADEQYVSTIAETRTLNDTIVKKAVTLAYLAGYDQRQQEDSGPTLDRDAALLAFKDGHNWHTMSGDLRLEYRAHATAARIMVGGTYAG